MEAWVGNCHLIKGEVEAQEDFQTQAAVLCASREEFEKLLQLHVNKDGFHILWCEEVLPVTNWLTRHGHNNTAIRLAKSVDDKNRVALADLSAVDADGNPIPELSYLTITEHEIEPLPEQTGIPFWDAEWIAPELKEMLFGQPEKGNTLRTYFIVDATLRKNITGFFDLDSAGIDIPIKCLFKGDAAEELKETAPYLIDMTLPEGAFNDKDQVPAFHKDFFKKHWGQNTGIFVRSTALMNEVWAHFRKFPRIQVEEDKRWVFFRFWDPRIAPSYFDSIKDIPEKAAQWVNIREGNRIEAIIGNQTDTEQPWQFIPTWEKLEGVEATGTPMLSDVELAGFARYRTYYYEKRAMAFFRKQFPKIAKPLSDDQLREVIQLAYGNAKKRGITSERDHFKYLIIVAHWGSYFETDPQYQTALKQAGWIDEVGHIAGYPDTFLILDQLRENNAVFINDITKKNRSLLGFERIYTKPPEKITYENVATILQNIWPARCERLGSEHLHRFIGKAGELAQKELKLTGNDLVAYIALALYFGAEFGRDPLYPWANDALMIKDAVERRHRLGKSAFEYFKLLGGDNNE